MRVAKSCKECRAAKRKCTVGTTARSCLQCVERNQSCSFATAQESNTLRSIAPNSSPSSSFPFVDIQTREHLVDLYLRLIHDKPHTLFHPPTLRAQVREDTLPKAILYGIMSLAARLSNDSCVRQRASEFSACAKDSFKMDILNIALESVQAGVLLGNICGVEGEPELESLFFGISFRLAQILHLPTPSAGDGAISQEIKSRTWWSLYMIDRWSSAGLAVPQQLSDGNFDFLPMQELAFWKLKANDTQIVDLSPGKCGLWGYMVILARTFGHIQNLHKRLADGALNDTHAEQITHSLASELETFMDNLPLQLHFSIDNLKLHASHGLGRAFVALHLGYHHYATLLYFPYLDPQVQESSTKNIYLNRCKHHAIMFSDILKLSHETEECETVYVIVAHMTVVSSAALIHNLLFGEHQELSDTRVRLCGNFAILLKLKQYWPVVDMMIERLFVFQKACMRAMEKIYTVDKWVVKFLLQHALPIEESSSTTSPLSERRKVANDTLSILRP